MGMGYGYGYKPIGMGMSPRWVWVRVYGQTCQRVMDMGTDTGLRLRVRVWVQNFPGTDMGTGTSTASLVYTNKLHI